jgi:hypothetical protein
MLVIVTRLLLHHVPDQVHGEGEDDGGVLLSTYVAQGLGAKNNLMEISANIFNTPLHLNV